MSRKTGFHYFILICVLILENVIFQQKFSMYFTPHLPVCHTAFAYPTTVLWSTGSFKHHLCLCFKLKWTSGHFPSYHPNVLVANHPVSLDHCSLGQLISSLVNLQNSWDLEFQLAVNRDDDVTWIYDYLNGT